MKTLLALPLVLASFTPQRDLCADLRHLLQYDVERHRLGQEQLELQVKRCEDLVRGRLTPPKDLYPDHPYPPSEVLTNTPPPVIIEE